MNILATSAPPEAKEGGQGNFSFFVNPSKQSEAESPQLGQQNSIGDDDELFFATQT